MKYSLAIYGAPYSSQAADTAYSFAQTAIVRGHEIYRLFFYLDGVHNASNLATPPQDETDIPARWRELIQTHDIDAVVCIAAGLRRGGDVRLRTNNPQGLQLPEKLYGCRLLCPDGYHGTGLLR